MAIDPLLLGLSVIIFIGYLIIFFILLSIQLKVSGTLKKIVLFGILAIATLVALRINTMLRMTEVLNIFYSQDILALLVCFFIFMVVYYLRKSVLDISGVSKKPAGRRVFWTRRKQEKPENKPKSHRISDSDLARIR